MFVFIFQNIIKLGDVNDMIFYEIILLLREYQLKTIFQKMKMCFSEQYRGE